jgi:hypothetical protein
MNKFLLIISLAVSNVIFGQYGCTDTLATNYDPNATIENGTCIYQDLGQTFNSGCILEPKVIESSGVEFTENAIWTHNDSGNSNKFYKINPSDCSVLQTITTYNFPNNDWEDITSDKDYLYLGNFGNNDGNRKDLKIIKIAKSDLNSSNTDITVYPEAINFNYADQTSFVKDGNTNFDCEAFFSKGDSLYLFTKNRGDYKTRVYALSKNPGDFTISPKYEFDCNGLITGADYDSINNRICLIGYEDNKLNSFIYYLTDFNDNNFFSGNVKRIQIGNSNTGWQTEGICFGNNDTIFISCENYNAKATLYTSSLKQVGYLSTEKIDYNKSTNIYPNPTTDYLTIETEYEFEKITISSLDGKVVFEAIYSPTQKYDVSNLNQGFYFLTISASNNAQLFTLKIYKND